MTKRGVLINDLLLLSLSIVAAILLVHSGVLTEAIDGVATWQWAGSLLAGFFFVSFFTVAPASVALVELSQITPLATFVFWGGLGATLGDLLIFRLVQDRFAVNLRLIFGRWWHPHRRRRWSRGWRALMVIIGALLVISPVPDEVGLSFMGLSHLSLRRLAPLIFLLNCLGIVLIALATRAAI